MDNRRFFLWVVLSVGFYLLWLNIAPRLFPDAFRPQRPKPVAEKPAEEPEPLPLPQELQHPAKTITLGEAGYAGGYLLTAQFNTAGASIDWIDLNDPRYTTLDRKHKYRIVGNPVNWEGKPWSKLRNPRTWETPVPQIDEQLKPYGTSIRELHWELLEQSDPDSITFRFVAPDQSLEVLKTFRMHRVDDPAVVNPVAYLIDVELTLKNLLEEPKQASYIVQGPTGIQVENAEIARIYRELKLGTLSSTGGLTPIHTPASTVFEQYKKAQKGDKEVEIWNKPVHYAGVDVQYFGTLVFPEPQIKDRDGDGIPDPTIEYIAPQLLHGDTEKSYRTDVSLLIHSRPVQLTARGDAKSSVTHKFEFFAGPKRPDLLQAMGAAEVIEFGNVPFVGWIPPLSWNPIVARFIMWLLTFLHDSAGVPYALCIILITVAVRGAMFPLSIRQVAQAERMKVFAPEMKKLQEQYRDKPEEYPRALSEFNRKHNVPNPLMGCLPVLLQMPIFFGLYGALGQAVDLRLARFLWIDNLAGQDALFHLPFTVPWFGWTEFNLLPILSVALFMVQFKLLSPPPANEEQEFQQKLQMAMMLAIGFAFYTVPAGLCLYIIVSSAWGLAERFLIKRYWPHLFDVKLEAAGAVAAPPAGAAKAAEVVAPREPSFFEKLLAAADEARNPTAGQNSGRAESNRKKKPRRF
jgi:YidC/Oxa1 family membrane protein insertase